MTVVGDDKERTPFDDLLAGAFARNGINTLLLDIKEDLGALKTGVAAIEQRVRVVEPTLWQLETERQRKIGLQQGLKRYVSAGRVAWLAVVGVVAWAAQHVPGWPWK